MEVDLRKSWTSGCAGLKEVMSRFGGSQSLLLPWLGHPCLEHTWQGRSPGQLDVTLQRPERAAHAVGRRAPKMAGNSSLSFCSKEQVALGILEI